MAKRISLDGFAAIALESRGSLELKRREIKEVAAEYDVLIPSEIWDNRIARGVFSIAGNPENATETLTPAAPVAQVATPSVMNAGASAVESFNGIQVHATPLDHSLIPDKDPDFVPWGNYALIKKLLSTDRFSSIYVVGETGNGKTFNFEQAAAALGKEIVTVAFTAETDEDDLIGGFRLVGGDTVWVDGPVIEAMKRGAILLLDEVDNGTEPVMALQAVLQGKPFFVKKLGRLIKPAPGFKVVATANTKGDGDGDYAFTNILNKAFLDRFKITIKQPYPTPSIEKKILNRWKDNNAPHVESEFINILVEFVKAIRETYDDGGISEQISTRRAVDIVDMYSVLNNPREAIELTTNRFDEETQTAMLQFWDQVAAGINEASVEETADAPIDDIPF